jgi:hypothetical protein
MQRQDARSVLLVTLDSCRYDTFESSAAPALKSVGRLWRAMAPGHFTYASHRAIFMGFTPGVTEPEPFANPKFAKIFKMCGPGFSGGGKEHFALWGRNIIDGFKRRGYITIGSGAVDWFDTRTETGRDLTRDFDRFFFPGNSWSLDKQLPWMEHQLGDAQMRGMPALAFLNIGETHVPYYFQGAQWEPGSNVCIPFGKNNDAAECRRRQRLCLEFVDRRIVPLIESFADSTIIVCGDHGDAWGEDGLWEHGIHHEKTLEVPLLFRLGSNAPR